jgi:hypothetical protein
MRTVPINPPELLGDTQVGHNAKYLLALQTEKKKPHSKEE